MATERTEFGFPRTADCSCHHCTLNCRFIPGYLVPSDVERMSTACGYTDVGKFADENLLASPGATVLRSGQLTQIHTLVPARKEDGSCKFLDEQQRCTVHGVSPFGCAFFDAHMDDAEANKRSSMGLVTIMHSPDYAKVWQRLNRAGKVAIPPAVARRQMKEAMRQ